MQISRQLQRDATPAARSQRSLGASAETKPRQLETFTHLGSPATPQLPLTFATRRSSWTAALCHLNGRVAGQENTK